MGQEIQEVQQMISWVNRMDTSNTRMIIFHFTLVPSTYLLTWAFIL